MTSVSSGPRSSAFRGDPAEVEHRQDVRVADLVLEREPDDVEPVQRRERLQAVERERVVAERLLEVGQRGEDALAGPVAGVHQAVEHLEPVVAHAQRVGVGEGQAERPLDTSPWSFETVFSSPPTYWAGVWMLGRIRETTKSLRRVFSIDLDLAAGEGAVRPTGRDSVRRRF